MENKWKRREDERGEKERGREATPRALHLNIKHTDGDKILARAGRPVALTATSAVAATARISRQKWPKVSEP